MTPAHITPGTDTTINPVVIDDSYRERKPGWNRSNAKEDSEFLSWCADRFEFHYNEDGRNPHIVRLRGIASHTPAHPPEAQQRVDAALLRLYAAKTYNKNQSWLAVEKSLAEAIALLQAGDYP